MRDGIYRARQLLCRSRLTTELESGIRRWVEIEILKNDVEVIDAMSRQESM
jgi:hypothetical protein